MDSQVERALPAVRAGEKGAYEALLRALVGVPAADLAALLSDDHPDVRRAAVVAAKGRTEEEVLAALRRLGEDPSEAVRVALSRAIEALPAWPLDDVCETFLEDDDVDVWSPAIRAAAARPALWPALLVLARESPAWLVRQAAAEALAGTDSATALPTLVAAVALDDDKDVSRSAAKAAEALFEGAGGWPAGTDLPASDVLDPLRQRLQALASSARCPRLLAWATEVQSATVDVEKLRRFGTDLTAEAQAGTLPRAHRVDKAVDEVVRAVHAKGPRAVVLLGPPGSGKTAVVHEVVHRLANDPRGPWRVLRVSAPDILAGTVYLGEWETKVRDLVAAVQAPRRVLLYVPNLSELAQAGRAAKSDLNVATMLAPFLESGAVAIVGESTPEAFRQGLGAIASLRRLFVPVEIGEASAEETREILRAVRGEAGLDLADADLDRLSDLAGMYLPGTAQPGRAVGLLRRVVEARERGAGPLTQRDVLRTLATSTGIPVDFLDDATPLDLARVREFFERRVMGQPEAVTAVLDLVALVKAGLSDPGKPFGVLLFIGPTGVGKTEMARALAEMLFGDPARLLRFDMSEYATAESHQRLIGHGNVPGQLTSAVREHPFSVVLLDEVEKAHVNAWDLCLQVFDAGRLTDDRGVTTDFRRTIVILTSNLGAAVPTEARVGFGGALPPPPDREALVREVLRFFRPEFVARIDQVVTFRPLALDTAEQIARREIAGVLERSGITRRRLTVDVDPSVLALLLKHGYSPSFGARPLKRTVERFVLLPIARAVAHGGAPPGSVVRLVARGDEVVVEVESEAPDTPSPRSPHHAAPARPGDGTAEAAALLARTADLARRAEPLAREKSELLARSRERSFWADKPEAERALDRVHRLERVLAAVQQAEKAVAPLPDEARAAPRGRARATRLSERTAEAARLVGVAETLVACRDPRDLGDAYLLLTQVRADGDGLDAVGRLASMYAAYAKRHGLEVEALDDRRSEGAGPNEMTLLVAGGGALALLRDERGMHQMSRRGPAGARGATRGGRAWVRVDVLPAPLGDPAALRPRVRVRSRTLRGQTGRLLAAPDLELTLVDEPTGLSLRAVTLGPKEDALARLLPVLLARIEQQHSGPRDGGCLRRYVLGPSPRASDRRHGTDTAHLDRVLKGELELLRPRTR